MKTTVAIGICSETHVVLACVNKANSKLWSHQWNIFKVNDYMGAAMYGLTSDVDALSWSMRSEYLNQAYDNYSTVPIVVQLSEKAQVCNQRLWRRPYGANLLLASLDVTGAHLYHSHPSGSYSGYQTFAIGSCSQAAKTYLKRKSDNFTDSSRDDLIKDALSALRETLQGEKLANTVCTVAVVGRGENFHVLDQETVKTLIDALEVVGNESPAVGDTNSRVAVVVKKLVVPVAEQGTSPMHI